MTDTPFKSPVANEHPLTPIRLRRGRRSLFLMATTVVVTSLLEVINYGTINGWGELPWQLFRLAVPLILIGSIWVGRSGARYLLAGFCGIIISFNLPSISLFPDMIAKNAFGSAILVVLVVGGYSLLFWMALFSSSITALLNFRRDELELDE